MKQWTIIIFSYIFFYILIFLHFLSHLFSPLSLLFICYANLVLEPFMGFRRFRIILLFLYLLFRCENIGLCIINMLFPVPLSENHPKISLVPFRQVIIIVAHPWRCQGRLHKFSLHATWSFQSYFQIQKVFTCFLNQSFQRSICSLYPHCILGYLLIGMLVMYF